MLLFAEIGNAVGSAIAAAIWKQYMPVQLEQHLAGILNSTEIAAVYGSIYTAATYKTTNAAAYEGIIESYVRSTFPPFLKPKKRKTDFSFSLHFQSYTMKILLIAGTAVAVIPPFLALGVKNIHLTETQNAVENEALDGRPIDEKRDHLV